MAGSSSVLLCRHLGSDAARTSLEDDLARRLSNSGHTVLITPHLYHLPHGSDAWREIAALPGDLAVLGWISPRAMECLLREYADVQPTLAVDLSASDDHSAAVEAALGPADGPAAVRELDLPVSARWYPVLDRSRCTACRHCLQFCLFGVYEAQEQRVVAVRPDSCKDGCPACARVCPHGAIIFPLSDEPAIAGMPGTLMQPDAAARRMYYVRTGRRCPVCGRTVEAGEQPTPGQAACDECGAAADRPDEAPSAVHEEIDALISVLDDLTSGGESE